MRKVAPMSGQRVGSRAGRGVKESGRQRIITFKRKGRLEMSDNFAGVGVFLVGAIAVSIIMMIVPKLLAPNKPNKEKLTTYECGNETIGRTWLGFKSNYFMYALVFTAFDIETVFLFPWAITFQKLGTFAFVEMFLFIVILLVGFWYAWKEGALEWM